MYVVQEAWVEVVFSSAPCMSTGLLCDSVKWWIHTPVCCWYIKKEVHWWLTYPEVFFQHSVLAGSYQTPKHTGTIPCVPWVILLVKRCLLWVWIFYIPSNHFTTLQWHSSTVSAHFCPPKSVLTEGKDECDRRHLWKHYLEAVKRNMFNEMTLFPP